MVTIMEKIIKTYGLSTGQARVYEALIKLGGKATFNQLKGKSEPYNFNPKTLTQSLKTLKEYGLIEQTLDIRDGKARVVYTITPTQLREAVTSLEAKLSHEMGEIYKQVSNTPKGSPQHVEALRKAILNTLTKFNEYALHTLKASIQSESEHQAVRRYLTLMDSGIIALTGNLMWILWENKPEALTLLDSILSEKESS
jgi:DNA-binding HxlR family transcriptional regulator